MAIQTTFDKIKSDSVTKLTSTQVVVKAAIGSSDGVVLGTGAEARVVSIEPMQGEARVNGKVNFKAVMIGEEGVISLDYNSDFTDVIKNDALTASSKLIISMNVIDTDSEAEGTDIALTAVVEIVVEEIRSVEMQALTSADDSVLKKTEEALTVYLKTMAEGAFEIYEEIETGAEIDKVLLYDAGVAVSSVKCGTNSIIIGGEAYAVITYRSGGGVMSRNVTIPFNEEIEADGADPDCVAVPEFTVKNKRIVLSGNKNDNMIRAEMVIGVKAPVFGEKATRIIADLYSCSEEITTEAGSLCSIRMVQQCCFKEKISATATLNEGMAGVQNIVTCCLGRNNLANLIPGNGMVTAEGLMTACVIYSDSENRYTSVRAELPYSLTLMDDMVMEGDTLKGYGAVYNVSARALSATEIEVKADIRICVSVYRGRCSRVIASLTEGGIKELNLNALSIYVASGGEDMWDVVKMLSASPEVIMEQNPGLEPPIKAGERIRVFRKI